VVCTDFGVALYSCCSRSLILLRIESMLPEGTWVVSVAGDAGSPATLAEESGHGGVVEAANGAGTLPFDVWRGCAGV
jgi:hypothetical protein